MARKRRSSKERKSKHVATGGQISGSAAGKGSPRVMVTSGRAIRKSRRQQRLEDQARAARLKRVRIIGLAVLVLALIGGAVAWRNAGVVPANELLATTAPNLDGPVDAPVRIIEYGDFGCPSCRSWHNAGIREQLRSEFGDQLSFEFRHFPVITPLSPRAAEASQCAAEQGAFWEFHDFVYEQTPQNALGVADLKRYAGAIGLEQERFDTCLDSGKYQSYVTEHMQEAFTAGARGTPSFYLDGQLIPFSYAGMLAAIEQALGR